MIKVAVDAMGGDYAPHVVVEGALAATREFDCHVVLVGDASRINQLLPSQNRDRISVVHAPETIMMGEHPAAAVRSKKNSSIVVGADLVHRGEARALVSAGNTGAAMAASLFRIGRIKGIERPGIGTPMPTKNGACLIIDAGANVDSRPIHLLHFAHMGSIYVQRVWSIEKPRIGLLNIGEERTKGSELTTAAYELLSASNLNFVGNVEGNDINAGKCDVVVCDGFVGNVILKFAEGLGTVLFDLIREEILADQISKIGALLVKKALRRVRSRVDYSEYGGAPLLGTKEITIIAHGRSDAKAIMNAIRVAKQSVEQEVSKKIAESIESSGE